MNPTSPLQAFLEAASAGLEGDPELQREVRAKLASHVESAEQALRAAGLAPDKAAGQALKSLGPATDIAAELAAANRRRLAWRARARLAVLALLVPVAVLAALYTYLRAAGAFPPDGVISNIAELDVFGPTGLRTLDRGLFGLSRRRPPRLTPAQRLVLHGDTTRGSEPARWRALWEAHPDNPVYLNHYITILAARYSELGRDDADRLAAFERELEQARASEPDNARFEYLLAGKLIEMAARIEVVQPGATNGTEALTVEIRDAAAYARALESFRTARGKPYLRRYASDMLREHLALLGEPATLREQIEYIAIAAGVLIPDASLYRNLARAACIEAGRHIEAGRPDDARALLEGCLALGLALHRDAFCLVDLLVANTIVGIYGNRAPPLYERMGDPAAADAAHRQADLLSRPVSAWRARAKAGTAPDVESRLRHQGSRLAALLLPAIGEPLSDGDLRPGRLLEYTLADRVVTETILILLLLVLAGCLTVWLRWRFARGGASAPLLLLPDGRAALRIACFGAILPLAGYFIYTRWLPVGGRSLAAAYLWPKLLLQMTVLAALILGLTAGLSSDAVRRRCLRLEVAVPPARFRTFLRAVYLSLTGAALAGCLLPSAWLAQDAAAWRLGAASAVAALLALFLAGAGLAVWSRFLAGRAEYGLYYGTVARSQLPTLALAMLLLSLPVRHYLAAEEHRLVRSDATAAAIQTGGFTVPESRLVEQLKQQTLAAARETGLLD